LSVVLPWGVWLMHQNGASWGYSGAISLVLIFGFYASASATVYNAVPRLHGRYRQVQCADLLQALVRLVLSIVAISMAALAIVGSSAAAAAQFIWLGLMRRQPGYFANPPRKESAASKS